MDFSTYLISFHRNFITSVSCNFISSHIISSHLISHVISPYLPTFISPYSDKRHRHSFFNVFKSGKSEGSRSSRSRASSVHTHTPGEDTEGEDFVVRKKKQSVADMIYQSFAASKEVHREQNSKVQNSHLDNEDRHERHRQRENIKREASQEKAEAHKRIDGFTELMAAKGRFETERQLVQRAEVRRFLCHVFMDIAAIEEEKKNGKSLLASITNYVTCSLAGGDANANASGHGGVHHTKHRKSITAKSVNGGHSHRSKHNGDDALAVKAAGKESCIIM